MGAVVGAVVVWLWGREMEEYVDEKTRGVRTKAAEGVRAVEEKAGQVLDRGGDALVGLRGSCGTRGRMSARRSGPGGTRFAQDPPRTKHDQKRRLLLVGRNQSA
jgi:hypothetical protein